MDRETTVRERMNKREKLHHYLMTEVIKKLEIDLHREFFCSDAVPNAWEEIATRPDEPKKVKLTLRVDDDLLKFFKATGRGYQTRMNDVLRAYMHSRLSNVIQNGARFERWVHDDEPEEETGLAGIMAMKRRLAANREAMSKQEQLAEERRLRIADRERKAREAKARRGK